MSQNAAETLVGAAGKVYVADSGTAAPTDATTALSGSWTELGFTTVEGVDFKIQRNFQDVESWQTAFPIRKINTNITGSLDFALAQFNAATLPLALGGGTITEPSAGEFKFEPAQPGVVDERALVVQWADNERNYRIYVARVINSEAVDIKLTRTNIATLPISFAILGSNDGTAPFVWLTDDVAFNV